MKTKTILLFTLAILTRTATIKAQNIPSYIPTNGLVGWWPFNGNANDESGNGNDGTVNGATLTTDRNEFANSAFSFSSNEIYIPFHSSFNSSNISVSAWINPTNYGSSGQGAAIVHRYQFGYSNPSGEVFRLMLSQDNLGFIKSEISTVSQTTLYNAPSIIPINSWSFVMFSFDGNSLKTYLNGSLAATTTNSSFQLNVSGNSGLSIGISDQANGLWYAFSGKIDDIGIWNRALTQEEITALYTATSTNNNATSNTTNNVPGSISYQAVARDPQGMPLADTNLQVRFTLIADSISGAAEYEETHTLTANSLGLFTTAFGAGTPVSNTFGNINWSTGHKFLQVQIDTGNGWIDMGTQQLLSTPYSMHSATSGAIKNPGLPIFADNAAALAGGLVAGDMYRTSSGDLKIVY